MLFPNGEKPVTITLYKDCPFDNKYTDHLFRPSNFEFLQPDGTGGIMSRITMKSFLNTKNGGFDVYPHMSFTDTFNFNYGNGLVTSITLEVPSSYSDANYLMVECTGEEPKYFFITNAIISNAVSGAVTIRFDLELDVIATYDNDFMRHMENIPVLTERKHCQRYAYDYDDEEPSETYLTLTNKPYCCDFVNDEPINKNIKPTMVKDVVRYKNIILNGVNEYDTIDGVLWAYVTFTKKIDNEDFTNEKYAPEITGVKGIDVFEPDENAMMPLIGRVLCIPLVTNLKVITYTQATPPVSAEYDTHPLELLQKVYDDTSVVDIRVSPYPPFVKFDTTFLQYVTYNEDTDTLTLESRLENYFGGTLDSICIGGTYFHYSDNAMNKGLLVLLHSYGYPNFTTKECIYKYPVSAINENTKRDYNNEPKCMLPPFTKYQLKSQYSDGVEMYPQLQLAYTTTNGDGFYTRIRNVNVPYSLDTAISTYLDYDAEYDVSDNYQSINYGLISTPNYNLPTGVNALKNFNETQKNQYVTGKIAQGITGSLQVLLGIGAVATGHAGIGAGLIVSGGSQVGKAVADGVSKVADLKNTPDSLNAMGSNYWHDACVDYASKLKPYVVVYEMTPSEKEMVLDYFYEYGYNVQRCCYFNLFLLPTISGGEIEKYNNYTKTGWVDERLFTRKIFNYIKLGEDISCKITDIPPIVKKKLSSIFQNGIKLWTFFNTNVISSSDISKYLFKNDYENPEMD